MFGRLLIASAGVAMLPAMAAAHDPARRHAERPGDVSAPSAAALLALLSPEQRSAVSRPFADDAARTNWHYLPSNVVRRDGVSLADLTGAQRIAVHKLLSNALSSQGYGKVAQIMWLETILHRQQDAELIVAGDSPAQYLLKRERLEARDPEKYWLVLFGAPGAARWGWMISGHHLALNFTMVDGRTAFTPLFKGAGPQTIVSGLHSGVRTLQHEIDRAADLVTSLDANQRSAAVLAPVVPTATLFADKGKKGEVTAPLGLSGARMSATQQAMLRRLVAEYLDDVDAGAAAAQWRKIERDGMTLLHFAWWGPTDDPAQRFMYRVHGPSILIDFVREPGADGKPGNHVHSIVRDPANDYGEGWLGQHYREAHQPVLP